MKRFFLIIFILFILTCPAFAKHQAEVVGDMTTNFSIKNLPDEIHFQIEEDVMFDDGTVLPANSIVFAEVLNAQRQLKWHKSGIILCKITSYLSPSDNEEVDVSGKEIFLAVKRYEKVYAKEATILGTEIILSQGASFFAPGVDLLYFFTKGAITRTTHPHWFMAGVSNAYENSICWFWLKGKDIDLHTDDKVEIKELNQKKYEKLSRKIEKRQRKEARKQEKKQIKQQKKELKKQKKLEKEQEKELAKQRLLQP